MTQLKVPFFPCDPSSAESLFLGKMYIRPLLFLQGKGELYTQISLFLGIN